MPGKVKTTYVWVFEDGTTSLDKGDRNSPLFRYDPKRDVVEVQRRGQKHYIDLAKVREDWEALEQGIGEGEGGQAVLARTGRLN